MTDKEKALARKQKLLQLQKDQDEQAQEERGTIKNKREEKLETKRDFAIAKMIKENEKEDKEEKKARAA